MQETLQDKNDAVLNPAGDGTESYDTAIAVARSLQVLLSAYQGSVPPPDVLRAYEEFSPGAANRFISLVEREQERCIARDRQDADIAAKQMELSQQQEVNAKMNYRWGLAASCALMLIYLILILTLFCLNAPTSLLIAMLGVPVMAALSGIISQFIPGLRR
jgi:uncharacterized membrane protein